MANGEDFNNIFSGDYWSPDGYKKRKAGEKEGARNLAAKQDKSNKDAWNAIGTGLGVSGAVTSILNSFPGAKKSEKKQAVAPQKQPFNWEAGKLSLRPNAPFQGNSQFNPNGTRQGADDIPESEYRDGPAPKSPLEILMERLNTPYQGTDPSKMDFSSLDKALQTRLGQIGDTRNQVQGNFDKSDANINGMHKAFENQIRTEDAASYNKIADTNKGNLTANMNNTVGALEAARAKSTAERQATMQNLGQQASAGAPDPTADVFNRGIATATTRNGTDQNMADGKRANNLAYNNTVAQSVGQAGVQRRSALQGQLQSILGKLSMAESEAKATNETERQRAMTGANSQGYDQWNDQQGRNMDMFKVLSGQEMDREKMANQPGAKAQGMGAIAEQLGAILPPDQASDGIAALNSVLSDGNYLQGANGGDGTTPYDRTNVLIQKLKGRGLDPSIATAVGIAYSKQ